MTIKRLTVLAATAVVLIATLLVSWSVLAGGGRRGGSSGPTIHGPIIVKPFHPGPIFHYGPRGPKGRPTK
jgi:hypothetical protein